MADKKMVPVGWGAEWWCSFSSGGFVVVIEDGPLGRRLLYRLNMQHRRWWYIACLVYQRPAGHQLAILNQHLTLHAEPYQSPKL